ncbi:MAG TPA: murein biosynthesis integral membrane protein MurJ [Legionellaceae bacterium]|nr:murein biosynthesis integral membrane protein MurJ [Legionellaceae bacterium]
MKHSSLLRSTSLVSCMTFISRIMGFVRDMLIAQFFGAAAGMDAFYVAFKIPNFMRRLFAEGAFSQAFVPVLAEYQQTKTLEEVRLFLARIAGTLSAVLTLVTLLGIIGSPLIIRLFAPGFGDDTERFALASTMLQLTFPYLMLISLTGMAGAILNTYGYFGVPAFTPVFLNICMILSALYLSPRCTVPVVGLAWGVLIAGIVQLLFQIPFLYRRQLLIRPRLVKKDAGVQKVLKLMVPALFGVSVAQINLLVDTIFASFLPVSSVTWLYYTDRLTDFPLGVFGVAIATVILPHLSRRRAAQSTEHFSKALDWGLRLLLLIGLPAGLSLAVFALPAIAACFAYGQYNAWDVLQTQKSLITLGVGVPAFMMVKVLASGFYACQNIKTPVKVGAVCMLANSILCAILIKPMAHAGLALASSLASYLNCALLLILLTRRHIFQLQAGWRRYLLQLSIANLVMVGYLFWVRADVVYWMHLPRITRLSVLILHISIAALIYLISLWVCGVRITHFRGQIKGES